MASSIIDVPWERLRAGVTILRADGQLDQATTVEHREHTVVVWFHDGRLERHDPAERAQVLIHTP